MNIVKSSILAALSSAAVLVIGATTGQAATIQSVTHDTGAIERPYFSQGVTIGSRADWDTITFAFDVQGGAGFEAFSTGEIYILTQDYLGRPEDLSASTEGFLAVSNGFEDGFWAFEKRVTLLADHTYYFVMGERSDASAITLFGSQAPAISALGFGASTGNAYAVNSGNVDFVLNGEIAPPAPVPLPATALMLLAGIGSLGAVAARRRRNASA